MSIYTQNGYRDRRDYLTKLALDNDVSVAEVIALADMFGESEDFDMLVSAVAEMA